MGIIYNNLTELLENTPLVELTKAEEREQTKAKLFAKLAFVGADSTATQYEALATGIWQDLGHKVDILVGAGAIAVGAGETLKAKNPAVSVVAEPENADTKTVLKAALDEAERTENRGKNIVAILTEFDDKILSGEFLQEENPIETAARERGVRPRPAETKSEIDDRGAFIRQPNSFAAPFGDGEGELKAAAGKYRLFWAKGCHWSNRASIVRELLGLEDAISVNIVEPTGLHNKYGWGFPNEENGEDPVTGFKFLSEAYYNADPEYSGRATVPSLVDLETKKIVNNDYHRLTNYFEVAFRPYQAKNAPDLYPEKLRREIDVLNDWLFPNINNAHYRMAFCQSLEAYKEAFDDFTSAMEKLDKRLENNRFLFGDYVTDSDVRFFVTLARWDSHYYRNLGPQRRRISDYKNVWAYARDLYEIPAFRHNTYFRDFSAEKKRGLFSSFPARFNDVIPYEEIWSAPQNRRVLSRTPEEKFLRHKEGE